MMKPIASIRLTLFFMLVGIFLPACFTTDTPDTRFYLLNPLDAESTLGAGSGKKGSLSVEVASLRLPQYLERPQIVTRSSNNRLKLAEFHQWGGNLRKNMMRVLAKNFSQLLATPHIAISPHRPPAPPNFRIELEVMQFERGPNRKVRLSAQWRLTQGKGQKPLVTRIIELNSSPISDDPELEYDHTVLAMGLVFGELSKIIGKEILRHKILD